MFINSFSFFAGLNIIINLFFVNFQNTDLQASGKFIISVSMAMFSKKLKKIFNKNAYLCILIF